MQTITTPNFKHETAKMIAEICNKICIDDFEAEVIKDILQDALNEYCMILEGYYEEEYYNAISSARNSAYDSGFDDGYDVGYDNGRSDSHSAV